MISRIIKVKLKWLSVTKMTLKEKNAESGGKIQIQVNLGGRHERSLQMATPKINPFVF